MLPKGTYFADQKQNEQVVLFIRRHALSFLPWMVFISLMVILPIIFYYNWKDFVFSALPPRDFNYAIIGVSAYYLIVIAVFLTAWIGYYLSVAIITPEHLVDIRQDGLFNRRISEQSLLRVQDVSAHMQGFLQTFFHYGTVFVETAGEAPNFVIPSIPYPNRVANTILKLHEEMVNRAGFEDKDLVSGVGLEIPKNSSMKKETTPHYFEIPKPQDNIKKEVSTKKNNTYHASVIESKIYQDQKPSIEKLVQNNLQSKIENSNFISFPEKINARKINPQQKQLFKEPNVIHIAKIGIEGELKEGEEIKL